MVYMYHSFLIHLSADGHLGCFHVLALINSAAMIFFFLTLIAIPKTKLVSEGLVYISCSEPMDVWKQVKVVNITTTGIANVKLFWGICNPKFVAVYLLTMSKPFTVWITTNCGKFWKRWEYQTTWTASWETCMHVRKQQLELDMEQQTGSK